MAKEVNEGQILIFDLETNGLLKDVSRIHCVAYYDSLLDETLSFNDECPGKGMSSPIVRAIQYLEQAEVIIGHNIIGYDLPVIRKLYPFFEPRGIVIDTLLLSRLYHSRLDDIDRLKDKQGNIIKDENGKTKCRWPHMPLQLIGRHSLEAYGYRLGEYKGAFGKTSDWSEWSQEMEDYCVQDVEVTKKLWKHFLPYLNGSKWNTR